MADVSRDVAPVTTVIPKAAPLEAKRTDIN